MELKVNDKPIRLRFGQHLAEMLLQDAAGKQRFGTIQFLASLIFYAHENYCLGYDEVPKVTRGEVFVWLEDNSDDMALGEELKKVVEAYQASRPAQAIAKASETGAKKKK